MTGFDWKFLILKQAEDVMVFVKNITNKNAEDNYAYASAPALVGAGVLA